MVLWILLSVLVIIAVLAPRFGTDSRDGQDWSRDPYSPAHGSLR